FVRLGNVPRFVMPSPAATLDALLQPNYSWWTNIAVTGTEIFGGYLLALVVGVSLALVFTWSKLLEAFFMPLLVSLNMIPKVALGPLIIVWFKYGVFPNSIMAFSIAVFPILLTTARGLREIEPELLDLVRSLKGSRWQLFTKIQLPGVRKAYGEHLAISDASFDVMPGELLSLVGPSGCGKSTLLKILAGLHPHDGGEVRIGSPSHPFDPSKDVGMVFQAPLLLK